MVVSYYYYLLNLQWKIMEDVGIDGGKLLLLRENNIQKK
jgi:hypothetical protein